MIDKHIYHLLVIEDKLIIPRLGIFTGKRIPASIQAVTNKFSVANKEISFIANNNIDDNKLIEYIAKFENISNDKAKQEIKVFVENIKKELEEKKKATIIGVGIFRLDSTNNIVFQAEENINFLAESFGKENFDSPAVKSTPKTKEEKKNTKQKTNKKQKKEKTKKKTKKEKKPKVKKKKRGWLWLLIFIALLSIGIAVWYYLQPEKVKNIYFTAKEKIVLLFSSDENEITIIKDTTDTKDSTAIEIIDSSFVADSIIEDSIIIEETNNTIEIPNNNQNINNAVSGKFYIVGGCFGNQNYANNLVNQLKTEGYSSFILDQSNGLYRVSYGTWDTEKQAEAELTKIKQAGNNKAWILEY